MTRFFSFTEEQTPEEREQLLDGIMEAIAWGLRVPRDAEPWGGHDPLPSFLYGRRGYVPEAILIAMLGPSDSRGRDDPPYDTCHEDCPVCAGMRAKPVGEDEPR